MLPVAVVWSSSVDNAIRYVLPVLWMTLFSHNEAYTLTRHQWSLTSNPATNIDWTAALTANNLIGLRGGRPY